VQLIYDIQLVRNERSAWLAHFGDIRGEVSADIATALATLARKLELHRELVDFMLSPDVYVRLTTATNSRAIAKGDNR
jgi:hypothetical protein